MLADCIDTRAFAHSGLETPETPIILCITVSLPVSHYEDWILTALFVRSGPEAGNQPGEPTNRQHGRYPLYTGPFYPRWRTRHRVGCLITTRRTRLRLNLHGRLECTWRVHSSTYDLGKLGFACRSTMFRSSGLEGFSGSIVVFHKHFEQSLTDHGYLARAHPRNPKFWKNWRKRRETRWKPMQPSARRRLSLASVPRTVSEVTTYG